MGNLGVIKREKRQKALMLAGDRDLVEENKGTVKDYKHMKEGVLHSGVIL